MAGKQGSVSCDNCGRALGSGEDWIRLDGGVIWCATCWMQRFTGPKAASPPAAAEPSPPPAAAEPGPPPAAAEPGPPPAAEPRYELFEPGAAPAVEAEPGPPAPPAASAAGQERPLQVLEADTYTAPAAAGHQAYPMPAAAAAPSRTCGLATASLVVSLVGILCAGPLLGVVAIVLGSLALNAISKDPLLGGRGQAIAGLLTGVVDVIGGIVLLAILFGSGYRF